MGAAPLYQHLLYFWTTVKEGGVTAAARKLRLAQPTISGQLRELENQLEVPLFERVGRQLRLTPMGRRIFEHADELFAIGDEILALAAGRDSTRGTRLIVGCADVMPKLVAYRLLAPVLIGPDSPYLRDPRYRLDVLKLLQIDAWLEANELRPHVVGEFDDSALLKSFAHGGVGGFFAPLVVQERLKSAYGAQLVGPCAGLRDRYYAISLERRATCTTRASPRC